MKIPSRVSLALDPPLHSRTHARAHAPALTYTQTRTRVQGQISDYELGGGVIV